MQRKSLSNKKCGNNLTASLSIQWPVGIQGNKGHPKVIDTGQKSTQSDSGLWKVVMPHIWEIWHIPRFADCSFREQFLFLPRVQIPSLTLDFAPTCAEVESKALATHHRAGWVLYLPNHRPPVWKNGVLSSNFSPLPREQQALWHPGSLGFSVPLWYLTCQLRISAGTLRCYCDIIIIIAGKWAKDSGLSRCFLLGLATGVCLHVFCWHNLVWAHCKCPPFTFGIHWTHH